MDIVEHLVRSFARRISHNGQVALVSNGHPALVRAFQHLGWDDPYIDPDLLEKPKPARKAKSAIDVTDLTGSGEYVAAVVEAPERAVLPRPKGRLDGGV